MPGLVPGIPCIMLCRPKRDRWDKFGDDGLVNDSKKVMPQHFIVLGALVPLMLSRKAAEAVEGHVQ